MTTGLREIAWLFLKLGTLGFGGPAAHIALMEEEVVRRRGWLTRERFLDYVGATSLIPGPNSTELAIHIGHARAGWAGLILAGTAFIVPATLIVGVIAWAYIRYGTLPEVSGLLYGVKPVMIAVVAQALWGLGRIAVRTVTLGALGVLAVAGVVAGVHELLVLAGAALIAIGLSRRVLVAIVAAAAGTGLSAASSGTIAAPFGLMQLFLVFAKIGSVLFGSGYVLLAFLRADFVERLGWLSESQLLDAIAIGQITPGPVFTTATFVGYLVGGPTGAVVATVGIFLPAFFFVAISGPLVPHLRRSKTAGAALDGVNVASLALMAVVSWQLAGSALVDPPTIAIALISLVALVRFRVSSAWLIGAAAVLGLLFQRSSYW